MLPIDYGPSTDAHDDPAPPLVESPTRRCRRVADGLLRDNEDGTMSLDRNFPAVSDAVEAVEELQYSPQRLPIDDEDWFAEKHGVPPDLRKGAAFRQLLAVAG